MSPSAAKKVKSYKENSQRDSVESLWVPSVWESREVNPYCSVSCGVKEGTDFSGSFTLVSSCS